MSMRLAPEFGLFCLALRVAQQDGDAAALRRAIAAAPDWPSIVAGARRHRLAARVLAGLQSSGATDIPDDVIAELRRQATAAAQRDLAQTVETGRLMRGFAEAGVRALALKGVVLSAQLHDGAFPRGARDIDLLVDPGRFAQADASLVAAGYRSLHPAQTPGQTAAYRRAIKDVPYVHSVTGTKIELHDRLTNNPNLLSIDFAALWNDRAAVRLGHTDVPTLARHRLPLYLTLHGAAHAWESLYWLVDLAAALREPGAVDAALAEADAAGLGAAMRHALILAHDWLGLAVDERVLAQARARAWVRHLDRILARLYADAAWHRMPPRASWRGLMRYSIWLRLYNFSLKTDLRYWLSQLKREWLVPADWSVVRLPDALLFLYPAIRPFGWLLRRRRR